MFKLFSKGNELEKLKKQYSSMMEKAMHTQRSGDLKKYALEIEEAEKVAKKIEELSKS